MLVFFSLSVWYCIVVNTIYLFQTYLVLAVSRPAVNSKHSIFNICYLLMLSTLGKIFSRLHLKIFVLFFPENRIGHFIQIVSKTFTNSADPDDDNKQSHQEIHCFAILLLILTGTPICTMDVSKFKDGRFHVRNLGVKGLMLFSGMQALRSVLNTFSVNNRKNMFVIREMSGIVCYLR